MPSLLVFLLALLGTYRLSHMIVMEDGPFDVFAGLREKVGQGTWLGRGLHCVLCISFWLSYLMMIWLWLFTQLLPPGTNIITWLGLAGGCLVLHKLLYRDAD